jgi:uncharacterized protein (TIGR03503 family)
MQIESKKILFSFLFTMLCCIAPSELFAEGKKEAGHKGKEEHASKGDEAEGKEGKEHKKKTKKKKKVPKAEPHEEKLKKDSEGYIIGGGDSAQQFDAELAQGSSIDAVLLLDSSGSMKRTDPNRLRDQAAKLFLRFLSDGDRIAVVQFDKEPQTILNFFEVKGDNLQQVDEAISKVSVEGRFTDLELPVVQAFEMLKAEGRKDTKKCVVLLSDGQMDPLPSRSTKADATERLLNSYLPSYVQAKIPLYTVGMSTEADAELLGKIAKQTDALYWNAPDVDTLHHQFSDLFLALKKPQTTALENSGFFIDQNIQEATFYIERGTNEIHIVDPKGEGLSNANLPTGVKWYKGEKFDVITIRQPLPGRWFVQGIDMNEESPTGFATLVTDLKLQVKWPEINLTKGDTMRIAARLIADNKPFYDESLKDITFYSYKIYSGKNEVSGGTMSDDGVKGDEKKGDGIYSSLIKIDKEGDYKAFINVSTPTFSRLQQIPFKVTRGLITFTLDKADEFSDGKDKFTILLGPQVDEFKNLKVEIVAEAVDHKEGEKDAEEEKKTLTFKPNELKKEQPNDPKKYQFDPQKLAKGRYAVTARISADEPKTQKKIKESSETIEYESIGGEEHAEVHEEENSEPLVSGDTYLNLLALGGALLWSGAIAFVFLRKFDLGKSFPDREKKYERPEALLAQLEQLKTKASQAKRPIHPDDPLLFAIIPGVYPQHSSEAVAPEVAQAQEAGAE